MIDVQKVRLVAAQRQAETMRGSTLQLCHNALVGNVHICRDVTRVRCTGMHTRARALRCRSSLCGTHALAMLHVPRCRPLQSKPRGNGTIRINRSNNADEFVCPRDHLGRVEALGPAVGCARQVDLHTKAAGGSSKFEGWSRLRHTHE